MISQLLGLLFSGERAPQTPTCKPILALTLLRSGASYRTIEN